MKKFITPLLVFLSIGFLSAQNPDIDLLRNINSNRNRHLDGTFQFISNSTFYPIAAFPLVFISIGLLKKDKYIRDQGLEMGASILFATLVSTSLKYIVNRKRPFESYNDIEKLSPVTDPSFPSGHTSTSFALATTLSLNFSKWYVIVPAYVWASSVAYSRMDLGVHYPTDIIGGIIIGSGSAVLSHYINKKLNKKANSPVLNSNF